MSCSLRTFLRFFKIPVCKHLCNKLGMHHIPDSSLMSEFQNAELGDRRLTRRLVRLADALAQQPAASIPAATGNWGQTCGAYRFLDHRQLRPGDLLASHVKATLARAAAVPLALAVNDTTTLNFGGRPATTGLGPIGNRVDKTRGLLLHSLLAFTPQRQPLGLLEAPCWARDPAKFGRNHQRNQRPLAEKESAKWLRSYEALCTLAAHTPQTQWLLVADREGDLYELFEQALAMPGRPAVLVRMQHNRGVEQSDARLFAHLASAPLAGQLQVQVPRRPGQAARTATVTLRYCAVRLSVPLLKSERAPLAIWAVEAREEHPPRGVTPLHWRLLTTRPVQSVATAVEVVQWYCVRWGIEVFHKVLKSGCAVEAAQLETAERLQRYLMIKLVVAWRVMALTHWGRERPAASISELLAEAEWRVLRAVATRGQAEASTGVPTVAEACRWIGQLGGHLGRRRDGWPGPLTLARGLQRLADLAAGWEQAQAVKGCA